jgi:hypothetical protein
MDLGERVARAKVPQDPRDRLVAGARPVERQHIDAGSPPSDSSSMYNRD